LQTPGPLHSPKILKIRPSPFDKTDERVVYNLGGRRVESVGSNKVLQGDGPGNLLKDRKRYSECLLLFACLKISAVAKEKCTGILPVNWNDEVG